MGQRCGEAKLETDVWSWVDNLQEDVAANGSHALAAVVQVGLKLVDGDH